MLNPINVPKAKPVKIRIISGGEEHSSLDSLRHHFNLDEVESLLDGRLVNWLNRIGEPDMAKKVSVLQQPLIKAEDFTTYAPILCELIRIFFPTIKASKLTDIVNIWKDTDEYKENAYYLYEKLLKVDCITFDDTIDIILLFYKEKPFETDWEEYFKLEYHICENPDRLFQLGKLLYEDNDTNEYKNIGIQMIEKAADLDYKAAKEYIEETIPQKIQDAIIKRREKNGFDEKAQNDIKEMISFWEKNVTANYPWGFDLDTVKFQGEKIQEIREFMSQILKCYVVNQTQILDFQKELERQWKKADVLNTYSPLYKEKVLILLLAYLIGKNQKINRTNTEKAIKILSYDRTGLESYPLYQCVVGKDVSSILYQKDIDSLTSPMLIYSKIKIIFEHLLDF
ncbi:MAG: hypothetical protein IJR02_05225 [Bacteroidaceae bacterium]|nr:hypothetical protein [Bacteroidaceae bacterium]